MSEEEHEFTLPDGTKHVIGTPKGTTPESAYKLLLTQLSGEQSSVMKDVGKSAGIGVAHAPTNILGMPGDVVSLMGSALRNEAGKYPGPVFPMPDFAKIGIPTSSDLQGMAEKFSGPWYQPQTTAGRYAKAGAEGAASMPLNPMMAATGLLGGLGGELGGQLTGGNPLGIAGGSLLTGTIPAGIRAVGTRATQRLREATSGMTQEEWSAAIARQRNAQNHGMQVTGPEAMGDANLLQQQRILENTPKTSGVMQRFFGTRFPDEQNAVNTFLNKITPQAQDPLLLGQQVKEGAQGALDRARQGANTLSQPSYNASVNQKNAFGSIGYLDPQIPDALRQDRVYQQAAEAVRASPVYGLARNEDTFSLRTMDASKKWLNDQISAALQAGEPAKAAQFQKALGRLTGYADDMFPDYAVARSINSRVRADELTPREQSITGKLAQTEDPIAQFQAITNSQTARRKSIEQASVDLRMSNPKAFEQLVRTGLENEFDDASKLLQSGGRDFAGARFVRSMRETPQTVDNVHAMLGKLPDGPVRIKAFNNVLDALEVTGNRLPLGSATAFNEMQKGEMTSQGLLKMAANPTAPLGALDRLSYNMTAKRLAQVFTDKNSVELIRKIAETRPGTAKMDAALAALFAGQRTQQAIREGALSSQE